jgi:hypothetical protein
VPRIALAAVLLLTAFHPTGEPTPPTCDGQPATIVGSGTIRGTHGSDVIVGSRGDDEIHGRRGDDLICAGAGDDLVYAGRDDDLVYGGPGNDELRGNRGFDTVDGEDGRDLCRRSSEWVISCERPRPANPGDSVNCSDFESWQEAQMWFDRHFPHYGDVAHLDNDGDGEACEGLRASAASH